MTELSTQKRLRAFISSTVLDLPAHRVAAVEACLRVGVEPIVIKSSVLGEQDSLAESWKMLEAADIYLAILAFRYGAIPHGQEKSLVELEFEHAVELGIPRLVFFMSDDHPIRIADIEMGPRAQQLESFKAAVRKSIFVTEFHSADELKARIVTGLVDVLRQSTRRRQPPAAFLLLPFGETHDSLRSFLASELQKEGVRVFRLDMMQPGADWANAVTDAIRGADFVIADVTDASPNVMYELGYVHALRKPTIMLAESSAISSVPSDLLGYKLLTYDKDDLESLSKPLARFLHEYAKEGR